MEIFVCIKQVPSTNKVKVDEKTGVLIRDGVQSKMNPYDLFALEAALRLKEACGAKVVVGTMGPPQAQAVIREAYMMGADEGYVFSDRRLGGADVLATSYTLSQAIRSIGDFDIIFCGKQTTDGDTAQVGPAIAEHLGIAHAAWVSKMSMGTDQKGIEVEQQLQDVIETAYMPFPCLITVEQDIFTPRLPSLKIEREIKDKAITIFGLEAFMDQDPSHYGLEGSPTQVERIFPPTSDIKQERWEGQDGENSQKLFDWLKKQKFV